MHVIDPMHNLLLGTAKHIFKVWIEKGFLDCKKDILKFSKLQKLINIPHNYGRISKNVLKVYKSMKADEWKNFVLYYSTFCMKEFLPTENFNHWMLYVKACLLLCRRSLTVQEIDEAHEILISFCKGFECLYGREKCTPNIHLHLHLKECVVSFGPVYAFWCFSFERFNGTLGSYHLNNKDIGLTIMRKFCKEIQVLSMDHSSFKEFDGKMEGSLSDQNQREIILLRKNFSMDNEYEKFIKVISIMKKIALSDEEINSLTVLLKKLEPDVPFLKVCKIGFSFKKLNFANDTYASSAYCKGNSLDKYVLSKFVENERISDSSQPAVIKTF